MPDKPLDMWAEWMLNRRYGGDPGQRKQVTEALAGVRERVLSSLSLKEGDTLLDVGTGDGLIAFGALGRVGPSGSIIFSDISQDLLDYCRARAEETGVLDRCRFLLAPADDLSGIDDASVDAVTTRSVLIFVDDKERAFREFFRVLRPGGRLSIFEPINRFGEPFPDSIYGPIKDIAAKVRAVYDRIQPRDTDPMLNFDERDLIRFAEDAGFTEIHLTLEANITPAEKRIWEAATRTAGNPRIPTLEEAINEALTPEEAVRFEAHLRPVVEEGKGQLRSAVVYMWAIKGMRDEG